MADLRDLLGVPQHIRAPPRPTRAPSPPTRARGPRSANPPARSALTNGPGAAFQPTTRYVIPLTPPSNTEDEEGSDASSPFHEQLHIDEGSKNSRSEEEYEESDVSEESRRLRGASDVSEESDISSRAPKIFGDNSHCSDEVSSSSLSFAVDTPSEDNREDHGADHGRRGDHGGRGNASENLSPESCLRREENGAPPALLFAPETRLDGNAPTTPDQLSDMFDRARGATGAVAGAGGTRSSGNPGDAGAGKLSTLQLLHRQTMMIALPGADMESAAAKGRLSPFQLSKLRMIAAQKKQKGSSASGTSDCLSSATEDTSVVSYDNPEATAIMRRRGTVRELAKQLKIEEFEREAEDMLQIPPSVNPHAFLLPRHGLGAIQATMSATVDNLRKKDTDDYWTFKFHSIRAANHEKRLKFERISRVREETEKYEKQALRGAERLAWLSERTEILPGALDKSDEIDLKCRVFHADYKKILAETVAKYQDIVVSSPEKLEQLGQPHARIFSSKVNSLAHMTDHLFTDAYAELEEEKMAVVRAREQRTAKDDTAAAHKSVYGRAFRSQHPGDDSNRPEMYSKVGIDEITGRKKSIAADLADRLIQNRDDVISSERERARRALRHVQQPAGQDLTGWQVPAALLKKPATAEDKRRAEREGKVTLDHWERDHGYGRRQSWRSGLRSPADPTEASRLFRRVGLSAKKWEKLKKEAMVSGRPTWKQACGHDHSWWRPY